MNYQFKLQEANAKNMEEVINILRKNHHDIGNHLNTILALTQKRELITLDKINEYVYSINKLKTSSPQ